MIQEAIRLVADGKSLTMDQSSQVMDEIMDGKVTPAQLGALATALRFKGETVDEVAGMARSMRGKCLHVSIDEPVVDTCGTGGDGSNTFNISTAVAFVSAALGVKIAKHGNRSASGKVGSADVLENLGFPFANLIGKDAVELYSYKGMMNLNTTYEAMLTHPTF